MILVDTTVLIDIERGREGIRKAIQKYSNEVYCVSAISILKIYTGLGYLKTKFPHKTLLLEKHKNALEMILEDFEIIPLSKTILKAAGIKKGEFEAKGIKIKMPDIIIGITAEISDAKFIMTRDTKHFELFSIKPLYYSKD